jgi:uncharacterized protein (TIGR02594 family)
MPYDPQVAAKAVDGAISKLGLHEKINSNDIATYLKTGGQGMDPSKTPWCAAFVGSALKQAGIPGSGSNVANSYMNWGSPVTDGRVQKGDVVDIHRGLGPNAVGGHVGLATGTIDPTRGIQYVAGNEGDKVAYGWAKPDEASVRRWTGETTSEAGSQIPSEGFTETKGQMPNDFLSQLGVQGTEGGGTDIGDRLMAVGAALMARDNPEGAAVLSRNLAQRATSAQRQQQPKVTQAPNGKGFVTMGPDGVPKYVPMPQEAQKEPDAPDQSKTDLTKAKIAEVKVRTEAFKKAQEARLSAQEARLSAQELKQGKPIEDQSAVKPMRPGDYEKAGKLASSVDTDYQTVENANRLQKLIAEGKLKPNFVKGKGWELQSALGDTSEEGRLMADYAATFNQGALRELASQKGTQSEKDAERIEKALGSGKPVDPRILYDTLGRVRDKAEASYRTNAGLLNNMDKGYPGNFGDDNPHIKDKYKNNLQGWSDFRTKTLQPQYDTWSKSFQQEQQPQQQQQSQQPVRVQSKEQWDAVPSGTLVIGPDGKTKRKP